MPDPMSPGNPFYNTPQFQALAQLSDFGSQEQQIAQQQALANQLREGGAKGIGRASQASRALSGISSAMMNVAAAKRQRDLAGQRQDFMQNKLPGLLGQGQGPQPMPSVPPGYGPG
jgi:hypothetical protein